MRSHKLLGQHFLKTSWPIEKMIQAAKEEPAVDVVLEIGPGRGSLTRALAKNFSRVFAVEKDGFLAEELRRNLKNEEIKNCEIIAGDILKIEIAKLIGNKSFSVIANIPYYLTSRLLRILLESKHQPAYIIVMVQKEVARRITAKPPDMNLLALSVQAYGQPKIIAHVSKKEFFPQPRIDSAIIKISNISKRFFEESATDENKFFALLKAAFSQKRKVLANSLAKFYGDKTAAEEKIKKAGLSKNARPQELNLSQWKKFL